MARLEMLDGDLASLGGPAIGDMLFELGMMYSVRRDMPVDLIAAHKWFNPAAVKGDREAIGLRREIANQMSVADIAPRSEPHVIGCANRGATGIAVAYRAGAN